MKVSFWKAMMLAFRIQGRILAALGDMDTPGTITKEELETIIRETIDDFFPAPAK